MTREKFFKLDSLKGVGQNVGNHVFRRTVLEFDLFVFNSFAHEVVLDVNMLIAIIDSMVVRGVGSTLVFE